MKINFVHLHTHSCYSKRDAHSRIDNLVKKAVENNQKAVALTDHGVLHGIPDLFRECKKAGIKPIAGMEGYITDGPREEKGQNFHQLLIVINEQGFRNISKLSSEAFITGFHNRPRMDMDLLRKHSEGLVATSSCLAGLIPQAIMEGAYKRAEELIKEFKDIFGDRFFLEIQPNRTPEQDIVNKKLIEFGEKLGVELVATGDVHYVEKEDMTAHQGMLCLARQARMLTDTEPSYPDESVYYMHHGKELFGLLLKQGIDKGVIARAMNNTGKIADMVSFDLVKEKDHLPVFPLPEGYTDKNALISDMLKEGLKRKVDRVTKKYIERVQFELGVIKQKGYQDYFLIVADAIKFAKSRGIAVNFGRGSGAGSLVAYLLDITEVDPLKYGLYFERFLDITRSKMPDIDTDIEDIRRYEVFEYLREKYGYRRVAQVANYGTMTAKLAFKNALMVYDVPFGIAQEVSSLIPDELGITIEEAYRLSPELRSKRKQKIKTNGGKEIQLSLVYDMAERFEGVVDKISRHAGGALITPNDIDEVFPVMTVEGFLVAQWNKDDVEELGGVKFDFLGLKTLRMVGLAVKSIHDETGEFLDIYKIAREHNDKKTYELIAKGDTKNVFQLNSSGMQSLCQAVKPTEFNHVVAINALYRPPALASGDTWKYARIKEGREEEVYSHPEEREITGETFGIITYQEHVMELVHHFAGWDYGMGDKLRKMKAEDLEGMREKFIRDASQYDSVAMDEIWSRIVRYMGYGFNKSHGVAYSMLTYVTAYLQAHYPEHWLSAIMSVKVGDQDKMTQVFLEIKQSGFGFSAPDVNLSQPHFTAHKGSIVFPLTMIKGSGDKATREIINEREINGPYKSIEDLMSRVNLRVVSKRAMKPLILAGAFDSLYEGKSRKDIYVEYLKIKKDGKKNIEEASQMEWNEEIQGETEKELMGVYLTYHPLRKYHFRDWNEFHDGDKSASAGGRISKVKAFNDKNQNRMAFVTLESEEGSREIVVFASTFKKFSHLVEVGRIVLISGKKDGEKLLADKIKELI